MKKFHLALFAVFLIMNTSNSYGEQKNSKEKVEKHLIHQKDKGLVETAIYDRIRLQLDQEQEMELRTVLEHIQRLKGNGNDTLPKAINDSIINMDHSYALNILTDKQFRRIVCLRYNELVKEANTIWNRIDSAQMVEDLDRNVAMYQIQQYLLDLKVVEETYWNDKDLRNKARHQIKVYAPQVIKRYFATKPKKNSDNKSKEVEHETYIW